MASEYGRVLGFKLISRLESSYWLGGNKVGSVCICITRDGPVVELLLCI
jgi:hypothetical protein